MTLENQAEQFVSRLFDENLSPAYVYHDFNHTKRVVEAVRKIAKYEQIPNEDTEKLLLAAWFHDAGYVKSTDKHETESLVYFREFAQQSGLGHTSVAEVSRLILATQIDHEPTDLLEQIIKDADFYHFPESNYMMTCENLRLEWKNASGKNATDLEWANSNLEMFNKHRYYTSFANEFWQPLKERNIERLQKQIQKISKTEQNEVEKALKNTKTERGIDTMFKITLTNHIRLSEIADSKANILLSVNAIIISITLSTIVPKLDNPANAHLILPSFIMVIFSVVSIIFAILSTKPKVTSGSFTRKDIEEKRVNLLFFGNFFKMPYEEYNWAVNEMLKDKDYLYNSMINDLYHLGIVLERKYRLLRITYNIFMVGIIVSVIAFVIAFKPALV